MNNINPDTEATLLLCGHFGGPGDNSAPPLELREYNRLIAWLEERGLGPADLVTAGPPDDPALPVVRPRLQTLLDRGAALALALESWMGRGIWVAGRSDERYPPRLRTLGPHAPALLFGAGDAALLAVHPPALAIVGSRDVDDAAEEFTREVAHACGRQGIQVVSGGARGVDSVAMYAALDAGGTVVGVLADSLLRAARAGKNGAALAEGAMALLSPYDPNSGFNVGNAMGRNKHIYALADAALVVSASAGSGGTWAGAVEALKRGATPVFVRLQETVPDGNVKLLEEGAHAFPDGPWEDLNAWLSSAGSAPAAAPVDVTQPQLW